MGYDGIITATIMNLIINCIKILTCSHLFYCRYVVIIIYNTIHTYYIATYIGISKVHVILETQ